MSDNEPKTFQVFKAGEAPALMQLGIMSLEPFDDVQSAGMQKMIEAGYLHGDEEKVLFNMPGFSLVHAWLKKDYPLLRHSHDSDCLYYIAAGSLTLGTQPLGPGDGFFVPAGVPYTYRPGPDGVEVLEFRHATQFNFLNLTKGAAFYEKAVETIAENVKGWQDAKKPSLEAGTP